MFTRINDSPVPYNPNMFKSMNEAFMPQMSKSSSKIMWILIVLAIMVGVGLVVSFSKKKHAKTEAIAY